MSYPEGIDVSKYQQATPSLAGRAFLFARATYDTTPDPMYAEHIANAKAAKLVTGAYHFGTHGNVPAQVAAFLSAAGNVDFLWLDLESNHGDTMTVDEAADFIQQVHAKGRKIGLYHSQSGFPTLGQDFDWVAKWSTTPPARSWNFWQYRGAPLDLDRFNGTLAQLYALAGRPLVPAKYRVHIDADGSRPVPVYDKPYGRVIGHIRHATYICTRTRSRPGLRWWYRVLGTTSGAPTNIKGRYLPAEPDPPMSVRYQP